MARKKIIEEHGADHDLVVGEGDGLGPSDLVKARACGGDDAVGAEDEPSEVRAVVGDADGDGEGEEREEGGRRVRRGGRGNR